MHTAAPSTPTSETRDYEKAAGILAERFELLVPLGLSGPSRAFSVRCRRNRDEQLYGNASLVLKVLDHLEPSRCQIFKAQVRAASMLQHENITPVLESG